LSNLKGLSVQSRFIQRVYVMTFVKNVKAVDGFGSRRELVKRIKQNARAMTESFQRYKVSRGHGEVHWVLNPLGRFGDPVAKNKVIHSLGARREG